jgi:hypothetical protein
MSRAGGFRCRGGVLLRVAGVAALVLGILGRHFLPGVDKTVGTSTSMPAMPVSPHVDALPGSECADCRLERLRVLVSVWRARVARLPPPAPPSLLVLSISRI